MDEVDGPHFVDALCAVPNVDLPQVVTQIRTRTELRGELHASHYAVNVDTAVGKRRSVLAADELAEMVGLDPRQKLVLELFGRDEVLNNRLWSQRDRLLPQIAEAGYHLVTGPSFSLWTPRPGWEHLVMLRRSNEVFVELQRLGVPAVPRLAWIVKADVQRQARWVNSNPIDMVALDFGTFRQPADWRDEMECLEQFVSLVERPLCYWINGVSTTERLRDVFGILLPSRCTISNAHLIATMGLSAETFSTLEARQRENVELAADSMVSASRTARSRTPARRAKGVGAAATAVP